jgi:2-succinyl-6-hydroxy-2,4-cyclohexadiene-1-carboxylate synthase
MQVLAVHGFLGQGSDWDLVKGQSWQTPSLFSHKSLIPLTALKDANLALNETYRSTDLAIGYSLGGRILLSEPGAWKKLVIIASNFLAPQAEERRIKSQLESSFIELLKNNKWSEFLAEWNKQPIFKTVKQVPKRQIEDYSISKLIAAIEFLSVTKETVSLEVLSERREQITWVVGERDLKYLDLYKSYKANGVIEHLIVIKDAGHRVLFDNPKELRLQLETRGLL